MEVRKSIYIVLVLFFLASMLQCSPKKQIIKEDEEAALKRRVQEYWTSRVKGEWDKCYQYESSDYKERVSIVAYVNQNARFIMKWEGYDILELWTSGEEGYVKLKITSEYLVHLKKRAVFNREVEERWIKKEGQWYRFS